MHTGCPGFESVGVTKTTTKRDFKEQRFTSACKSRPWPLVEGSQGRSSKAGLTAAPNSIASNQGCKQSTSQPRAVENTACWLEWRQARSQLVIVYTAAPSARDGMGLQTARITFCTYVTAGLSYLGAPSTEALLSGEGT